MGDYVRIDITPEIILKIRKNLTEELNIIDIENTQKSAENLILHWGVGVTRKN